MLPLQDSIAHVPTCFRHHERKPLHAIFLPMFDVLETHLEKTLGTNACPATIATPLAAGAAFRVTQDEFKKRGICYLHPLVNLLDRQLLGRQMFECWDPLFGLSRARMTAIEQSSFATNG